MDFRDEQKKKASENSKKYSKKKSREASYS
jgi:hypothetical protein